MQPQTEAKLLAPVPNRTVNWRVARTSEGASEKGIHARTPFSWCVYRAPYTFPGSITVASTRACADPAALVKT